MLHCHKNNKTIGFDNKNRRKKSSKFKYFVLLALIICSAVTSLPIFQPTKVNAIRTDAAGVNNRNDLDWQIKSYLYYWKITSCLKSVELSGGALHDFIATDNANSGAWFSDGLLFGYDAARGATGVYLKSDDTIKGVMSDDGITKCSEPKVIAEAMKLWGLSASQILCNSGFYHIGVTNQTVEECVAQKTGDFKRANGKNQSTLFSQYINYEIYNRSSTDSRYTNWQPPYSDSPNYVSAFKYIYYRESLNQYCIPTITATKPSRNNLTYDPADNGYANIKWVDTKKDPLPTKPLEGSYQGVHGHDQQFGMGAYVEGIVQNGMSTCGQIATAMSDNAQGYIDWFNSLTKSEKTDAVNPTKKESSDDQNTCGDLVSGVGWIICPVIDGLTTLNDQMFQFVSGLLKVNPISQASQGKTIFNAWSAMRNLANVAFVIMFLIMIFSQVSNAGISNYGIKKLLPRLIIGAVLVNVSFFLIQIVVDLANILGSSLYDLIMKLAPALSPDAGWGPLVNLIAAGGVAGVAAGAGLAVVGAGAAFWLLLPMAAMGALGLLAAVITLIFRQAIIPVLVILAPLAIVAYLFPNTETLFKKWKGLLIPMLTLYPLAALVFGGVRFAASIIIGDAKNWWNLLIGLIIMTLPLFSLPFLAKQGGAITNAVGGALNKMKEKARAPMTNLTKSYADQAKAKRNAGLTNSFGFKRRPLKQIAGEKPEDYENRVKNRKRTAVQALNEGNMRRKANTENLGKKATDDWRERGANWNEGNLPGASPSYLRSAQKTANVLNQSQSLGVRSGAIDTQYKQALAERIGVNGSADQYYDTKKRDAEHTIKKLDKAADLRHSDRVLNNERSTTGSGGLRDIAQATYASEEAIKASELKIDHSNKQSGVANASIQEQKKYTELNESLDKEQQATYDAGRLGDKQIVNAIDSNTRSEAISEKAKQDETLHKNILKDTDPGLKNIIQEAEDTSWKSQEYDTKRSTEFEERKATDPTLSQVTSRMSAYTQAGKTAKEVQQENYAKEVTTEGSSTQVIASGNVNRQVGKIKAVAQGTNAQVILNKANVDAAKTIGGNNSEAAYQGGVRVDPATDDLYYEEIDPVTKKLVKIFDTDKVTQKCRDAKIIGDSDDLSKIDPRMKKSLHNVQDSAETDFGVQAIIENLSLTKQLTSKGIEDMVDNLPPGTTPEQKAKLMSDINNIARANGMPHLSKNTVDSFGIITIGGQKGTVEKLVKDSIDSNDAIPNEALEDEAFDIQYGIQFNDMNNSKDTVIMETFDRKLIRMDEKQIGIVAKDIFKTIVPRDKYPKGEAGERAYREAIKQLLDSADGKKEIEKIAHDLKERANNASKSHKS